uniref:Uncharacterized protein n=1 Tax=Knipowitschia caucasica TaxID=637954 RepID=A0AAV2LRB1_KNICA
MKWQCQDFQLVKTKRSCRESARPDAAADVPCVPNRATVCLCVSFGNDKSDARSVTEMSRTGYCCQHCCCFGIIDRRRHCSAGNGSIIRTCA